MSGHAKRSLWTLLLLAPATLAWTGAPGQMSMRPQSRLWINGNSTVRAFECKAAAFETVITTSSEGATVALLAGRKAVESVEVTVPAAELGCGNGTMDEHMLKALKAKEHSTITFRLTSYDVTTGEEGISGTLRGSLLLGGTEKPIAIDAAATQQPDGTLRVQGSHQLRMSEYGLKRPTLMLGTLKVHDEVTVGFDLYLEG